MTRAVKVLACVLLVAVVLWACAETPPAEPLYLWRSGPHFRGFFNEDNSMGILILDINGNEFFRQQHISRKPQFSDASGGAGYNNWMRMDIPISTGHMTTRFFDTAQRIYSPEYINVIAQGYGLVFWSAEATNETLVVHDMFDPQLRRFHPQLDAWCDGYHGVTSITEQLIRAEFLNPTQLRVEYLNASGEFVTETITLQ
ncbi:MAG: hypothetical protein FWB76_03000 [Oscillospiraceae bacterium]|nr:hypothetical protein [Oscillospiraceae bacterium]